MASPQTLVIIGSGPMIGVSTASLFAAHKFSNIALISRDATRLSEDRESVLAAAVAAGKTVNIQTWSVDIKNTPAFEKVLKDVKTMGCISSVLFNAARVGPSELFKFPEEEIIEDFKTTTIALYTVARWAMPLLALESDKPSFLVTSGLLHDYPIPILFSLSVAKAAQRTLVLTMQRVFMDVHVALLYIGGAVSPEEEVRNPANIAEQLWKLYSQEKSDWAGEMTI